MATLHARLTEMPIVQNNDGQILRLLATHRRKAANAHEGFTIAGDHDHFFVLLCECYSKAHADGAAHGAPQVKSLIAITTGEYVVGRRAQASDD